MLLYCIEHDRFTDCFIPDYLQCESCKICHKQYIGLSIEQYHQKIFPCSSFTLEGRIKDKKMFLDLRNQYMATGEDIEGIQPSISKSIKISRSLVIAWMAYSQQLFSLAEEMRNKRIQHENIKNATEEEKQWWIDAQMYIRNGVADGSTIHGDTTKIFCFKHMTLANSLPLISMNRINSDCKLCENKIPPKSSLYNSNHDIFHSNHNSYEKDKNGYFAL